MDRTKELSEVVDHVDEKTDIEADYKFARARYYDLVTKGADIIEVLMELARDSEHPRIFEVLSNMMKQNAEIADRLLENQKTHKAVSGVGPSGIQGAPSLTQNNVYVGSTTDLQRMLQEKMKKAKDSKGPRIISQDE
jgi:galactitol-specific phosphotransferase system IIB component